MSSPTETYLLDRFRAIISGELGLSFDATHAGQLIELLHRRAAVSSELPIAYLSRLENRAASREELRTLAREITVGETYFFRHVEQCRAFAEAALPNRIAARSSTKRLRVLSAGCSSGEETYTLAMLIREYGLGTDWDVSVRGVDLNPAAIERANQARYSAWSMRETRPDVQRRWFVQEGKEFALDRTQFPEVSFQERNLTHDDPDLWPLSHYDIVFCRNVLMYFVPEISRNIVARMIRSMAPGGYLFIGHAESLRGLSLDVHLQHTHRTFYYQRRDVLRDSVIPPSDSQRVFASVAPMTSTDVPSSIDWPETIQRATDRIRVLDARSNSSNATVNPIAPKQARSELGQAFELLKSEQFAEALQNLAELPTHSAEDPEVLLLRAVLLSHRNETAEAERTCLRLLEIDELNAGAHYVLALCREADGDREGTIDHDQIAAYLDPTFAMPRVQLGLLARRSGDRDTARRELEQSILLLQREEAARVLLFGGGFSRDALITLCRAELSAIGDRG